MDRWPCWTYFNKVLDQPDWTELKILDFGGNWGNFLRDPDCSARPQNYWCLDVDQNAIKLGKQDFPQAHWLHYNRWNQRYNPQGNYDEPFPVIDMQFDLILAYSVFTHTSREDMVVTVNRDLMPLLHRKGKCVLTFLTPEWLQHFLDRYSKLESDVATAVVAAAKGFGRGFYLLGKDTIVPIGSNLTAVADRQSLTSFYSHSEILCLWPGLFPELRLDTGKYQTALVLGR